MTTIAYDEKTRTIAYDSRITQGFHIANDSFDKKVEKDGVVFVIAGRPCDYEALMDCFINNKMGLKIDGGPGAFVVEDGKVWECAFSEHDGFWKSVAQHGSAAIGSGCDHALAAMDCGLNAKEAVKMAMKRDCATGGKINVFKLSAKP